MKTETISRTGFVHRYPLVSFYILAWAFGGGIVYLVMQEVIPTGLTLASALSASVAGIIMTAVIDGRTGLKLMFSRLLSWRVGIGYWLFAILFIIPVFLLGSLFNPIFSGDPIATNGMEPIYVILLMFISFFIVAGLGEELGWTGFLIPRLQARFNALKSSVIRAILVGLWHLPLFLFSWLQPSKFTNFPYAEWITQKGFLIAFMVMVLMFSVPWSIFYTWIFNNTGGSLLLVAVLHGSEIWVAYGMLSAGINPSNINNYWGYGAVMVLMAIIIVFMAGSQNLSRKNNRIVHQPLHGK
jgi:membrane protease YdiL (CAAX protease family)